MSLARLKRNVATDQRNAMTATVVADGENSMRVRAPTGEIYTAKKTAGTKYAAGAKVEIRKTGRLVQVEGDAPLRALAGELTVTV